MNLKEIRISKNMMYGIKDDDTIDPTTIGSIDHFKQYLTNIVKDKYGALFEECSTPILPTNCVYYAEQNNCIYAFLYYPQMERSVGWGRRSVCMEKDCSRFQSSSCYKCGTQYTITVPPEVFAFMGSGKADRFDLREVKHFSVLSTFPKDNILYGTRFPGNTYDDCRICWGSSSDVVFGRKTSLSELQAIPEFFYASLFNNDLNADIDRTLLDTRSNIRNNIFKDKDAAAIDKMIRPAGYTNTIEHFMKSHR